MRPRTVFAPFEATANPHALGPIIESCATSGAHLTVGVFAWAPRLPYATPYDMTGFNAPVWGQEVERARDEAASRCRLVDEAMKRAGAEGGAEPAVIERFQIDETVADRARFSDLTMIPSAMRGEVRHRAVNGGLFLSPAPVLLVSDQAIDLGKLDRVMLAWDGGMESGDAIRAILPMLSTGTDLRVAMVDPLADSLAHGSEPGADLAAWLARHDMNVTVEVLSSEGLPVSKVLARHAVDLDADLIVMGGYGHGRLRERVFGGTTRRMIDEAKRPVMLAR